MTTPNQRAVAGDVRPTTNENPPSGRSDRRDDRSRRGGHRLLTHSIHRDLTYLGGPCTEYKAFPYIDPWTGHWVSGLYVDTSADVPPFDCSAPGGSVALDPPPDLAGSRAIPMPIGFALGATGALAALTLLCVSNRRAPQTGG